MQKSKAGTNGLSVCGSACCSILLPRAALVPPADAAPGCNAVGRQAGSLAEPFDELGRFLIDWGQVGYLFC